MLAGDGAASGRLAIIAGGGLLPHYLADAARRNGENPLIIQLLDEPAPEWRGFDVEHASVGDFSGMRRHFQRYSISRVVLSGSVRRRPEWRQIRPTLGFLAQVPFVLKTLRRGGDNAVLEMVIGLLEALGCKVIGAHEIAPDLLASAGPVGALRPDTEAEDDIRVAIDAALQLGRLDIGQGAVAVGGRVVALEGPEGTDAMLARVAEMRANGRISRRRKGVLVKLAKPQQDERADLPALGLVTLENARLAGLSGIVGEAGRALILDRTELARAADAAGMFVHGVEIARPEVR
ncbi:LpxI family protein [Rhizobium sp. C4]|uniref:LpxI family protein n=1 Tax=Rhizobium sp. C4 TaxID=1349800 RepID=UPI001E51D5F6|nr:UDP-2,3-diacylglucosamine diphosphatase LpxI [Rhizobium sp. C4]MCD2171453.1 UDP-2,3-diacylglucosamine diphosphatase LpxI [Rhizobium sp. C4]